MNVASEIPAPSQVQLDVDRQDADRLAIRTKHLTKIYSQSLIAVNDMNLEVPKGSVFALLGPNGAGKTTALRLILGLQHPTAGTAEVFGRKCGPNAVDVRSRIGYLPTNPKLPEHLRPIEYLDLLGKLCGLTSQARKPVLSSLLRAVGLLGATSQRIGTFSTGMCTRLGIAASLVGDPPLLIWDEPTAGLDPSARRFTLDFIRELGKTKTIVVATHILSDIDQISDHLGVMHEGRMIYTGSMDDMRKRLRYDEFSLDLDGTAENVRNLGHRVALKDGVEARIEADRVLHVRIAGGPGRAGVLAGILALVEGEGVSLSAIRTGQNTTEDAYLQLLQEDHAHGFDR
jgi:ABC-2 type transport system ATP-binding protein